VRVLPSFLAARAVPYADTVTILVPGRGPLLVGPDLTSLGLPCRTDQPACFLSTCTDDRWIGARWNEGVCCLPGQVACRGSCRWPCPNPRHVYEGVNCTCECPNTYPDPCGGAPWVLSQSTCQCECDLTAPCPVVGQTRDPVSCTCQCPPGQIPCQGVCIDPRTDIGFCGSCPGATCNPATQLCCNGVCTDIGTDANCSNCGDQVPAGWACCNFTPTQLGTTQNCAGCGDVCTGGKQCVGGRCQCPPGRIECAGVCCPTTHQGCCNNTCTNLNTSTAHCGGCNRPCPGGASCVSGQCQCPAGSQPCGGQCWPNAQLCCENKGCPPNSTDCCAGCAITPNSPNCCQDFMTLSARQQHPAWAAWRQAHPGQKWASCADGTVSSFKCGPDLTTFTIAQGVYCCPPGCTGVSPQGTACTCP
jgi:hypothetical protein